MTAKPIGPRKGLFGYATVSGTPEPAQRPAISFTINPRQQEFIAALMAEVARAQAEYRVAQGEKGVVVPVTPGYRTFHYGGAIRGGKTIAALGAACLLAKAFPRSRWHVVRASFPDIRRTVLPSLDKVLVGSAVRWRRQSDDYYFEISNGSRVYMFAEAFDRDKDLDRWKGLETNGFIFEQLEEIQEAAFEKARERAGSWYNVEGAMPPPFILSTFNPAYNWIKEKIFDVWFRGELPADELFVKALPTDNPLVTEEQRKSWAKMPRDVYERFIKGSWEVEVKGAFLNTFDVDKHTRTGLRYDPSMDLWISFDFNVDPMTAIVFQTDGLRVFRVLKEYRIMGGDVFAACEAIRSDWWALRPMVRVTGDATGDNRMAGVRGAVSQYRTISEQLGIDYEDFDVPSKNPFIADSRIYCNSVIQWLPVFEIDAEGCPHLIRDCRFVQKGIDTQGRVCIEKSGVNLYTNTDNKQLGHLLDCLRYGIHVGVPDFMEIHRS